MREIPRGEWVKYLDGFSRRHEGWLVTVEVLGAEIGAQVEAQELPLEGITAELKAGGEDARNDLELRLTASGRAELARAARPLCPLRFG